MSTCSEGSRALKASLFLQLQPPQLLFYSLSSPQSDNSVFNCSIEQSSFVFLKGKVNTSAPVCDPNSEWRAHFSFFSCSLFPLDPWGEHYARINAGPIRDPYRVWLLSIDLPPPAQKRDPTGPTFAATLFLKLQLLKVLHVRYYSLMHSI